MADFGKAVPEIEFNFSDTSRDEAGSEHMLTGFVKYEAVHDLGNSSQHFSAAQLDTARYTYRNKQTDQDFYVNVDIQHVTKAALESSVSVVIKLY